MARRHSATLRKITWRIGQVVGAIVLAAIVLIVALAMVATKLDWLARIW